MAELTKLVEQYGLNKSEAKLYLAALELGEASVQEMARKSGVPRTSIYYILNDLVGKGVLISLKRNKKTYYTATSPTDLLKSFRQRLSEFEQSAEVLLQHQNKTFKKPRVDFLQGPSGFKQTWNMIFNSDPKEFRIITEGINFLDFVKQKYVINEIIQTKKKLGVKSYQIIPDTAYARNIIKSDSQENRESRILPSDTSLPFTEIICPKLVAYISPKFNDTIFIIEDPVFAESRKIIFDLLWKSLPKPHGK